MVGGPELEASLRTQAASRAQCTGAELGSAHAVAEREGWGRRDASTGLLMVSLLASGRKLISVLHMRHWFVAFVNVALQGAPLLAWLAQAPAEGATALL